MEGWSGTAASPELASGLLPRKMKDTFLTRKLHSKRTREQAGTYQMHKTKSCPGCYLRFRDLHRLFSRGVPPARNKKPHLTSKKCQCAPIMMWNCSNTVLGPCKSASSMASADLFFHPGESWSWPGDKRISSHQGSAQFLKLDQHPATRMGAKDWSSPATDLLLCLGSLVLAVWDENGVVLGPPPE